MNLGPFRRLGLDTVNVGSPKSKYIIKSNEEFSLYCSRVHAVHQDYTATRACRHHTKLSICTLPLTIICKAEHARTGTQVQGTMAVPFGNMSGINMSSHFMLAFIAACIQLSLKIPCDSTSCLHAPAPLHNNIFHILGPDVLTAAWVSTGSRHPGMLKFPGNVRPTVR